MMTMATLNYDNDVVDDLDDDESFASDEHNNYNNTTVISINNNSSSNSFASSKRYATGNNFTAESNNVNNVCAAAIDSGRNSANNHSLQLQLGNTTDEKSTSGEETTRTTLRVLSSPDRRDGELGAAAAAAGDDDDDANVAPPDVGDVTVKFRWYRSLSTSANSVFVISTLTEVPLELFTLRSVGVDAYESRDTVVPCGTYRGGRLQIDSTEYQLETFDVKHYSFEIHLYIEEDDIDDANQSDINVIAVTSPNELRTEPATPASVELSRPSSSLTNVNHRPLTVDQQNTNLRLLPVVTTDEVEIMDDVIVEDDAKKNKRAYGGGATAVTMTSSMVRGGTSRRLSQLELLLRQQIACSDPTNGCGSDRKTCRESSGYDSLSGSRPWSVSSEQLGPRSGSPVRQDWATVGKSMGEDRWKSAGGISNVPHVDGRSMARDSVRPSSVDRTSMSSRLSIEFMQPQGESTPLARSRSIESVSSDRKPADTDLSSRQVVNVMDPHRGLVTPSAYSGVGNTNNREPNKDRFSSPTASVGGPGGSSLNFSSGSALGRPTAGAGGDRRGGNQSSVQLSVRPALVTSRTTPLCSTSSQPLGPVTGSSPGKSLVNGTLDSSCQRETDQTIASLKQKLSDRDRQVDEMRQNITNLQCRLAQGKYLPTDAKDRRIYDLMMRGKENIAVDQWQLKPSNGISAGTSQSCDSESCRGLDTYSSDGPAVLQRKLDELQSHLADVQEASEATSVKLSDAERTIAALRQENDKLRASCQQLEGENNTLREQLRYVQGSEVRNYGHGTAVHGSDERRDTAMSRRHNNPRFDGYFGSSQQTISYNSSKCPMLGNDRSKNEGFAGPELSSRQRTSSPNRHDMRNESAMSDRSDSTIVSQAADQQQQQQQLHQQQFDDWAHHNTHQGTAQNHSMNPPVWSSPNNKNGSSDSATWNNRAPGNRDQYSPTSHTLPTQSTRNASPDRYRSFNVQDGTGKIQTEHNLSPDHFYPNNNPALVPQDGRNVPYSHTGSRAASPDRLQHQQFSQSRQEASAANVDCRSRSPLRGQSGQHPAVTNYSDRELQNGDGQRFLPGQSREMFECGNTTASLRTEARRAVNEERNAEPEPGFPDERAKSSAKRLSISSTSTESILLEADWLLNSVRQQPQQTQQSASNIDGMSVTSSGYDQLTCLTSIENSPNHPSAEFTRSKLTTGAEKSPPYISPQRDNPATPVMPAAAPVPQTTNTKRPFAPRSPNDISVGDIIKFSRQGGKISKGHVKYVGRLPGKNDTYIGVELEHEMGKHDGVYSGHRIFQCQANRGVFVAFSKVIMAWCD